MRQFRLLHIELPLQTVAPERHRIACTLHNSYGHFRSSQLISTFLSFGKPTPDRLQQGESQIRPSREGIVYNCTTFLALINKDSSFIKSIFEKRAAVRMHPLWGGAGVGFVAEQQNLFPD